MKKHIIAAPLFFVALSLSSCSFFNNKDWVEKYGTPELFLDCVVIENSSIRMYNEEIGEDYDYEYEVKDALLNAGPFEKTSKKRKVSEKYFTYYHLISPANSGPNYCQMSIYDDGYIKIDHKSSLGSHQYAYLTMDAQKASEIVDFTFSKIENNRRIRSNDEQVAKEKATIEAFIQTMRSKSSSTRCQYSTKKNETFVDSYFYDDGNLLSLIENVQYTPITDVNCDYDALVYNDDGLRTGLEYRLDSKGIQASVEYRYINSLNEHRAVETFYSLNYASGFAILEEAKALAESQ